MPESAEQREDVDRHGSPPTREDELGLCAYFGILAESGRAGEVSARPPESVSARLGTDG